MKVVKRMNETYQNLLTLVPNIDTECSGVDDENNIWVYLTNGITFKFCPNDDGEIEVYNIHYSDMVSKVATLEVYPNDKCNDNWSAGVIALFLQSVK